MKKIICLTTGLITTLLLTLVLLNSTGCNRSAPAHPRQPVQPEAADTCKTIEELYKLNGRQAGTADEAEAAKIIASCFKETGLKPLDGEYRRQFLIGQRLVYNDEGRLRFRMAGPPKNASQNVLGIFPGKDTQDPWIIFCAHYDGQGVVDGEIFPSANDNLSGIYVLFELADKLNKGQKKSATLAFIAFGAEEPGLLGSNHFTSNLPVPPEKIRAVINLDTVGKTSSTLKIYTKEPDQLTEKLQKVLANYDFQTKVETFEHGVSDHYPFSKLGIPALTLMSGNWHDKNHTPQDTLAAIDRRQISQIVSALLDLLEYKLL